MTINGLGAAGTAAREAERTTLALARILRTQREQAAATVALIEQAAAPAATGRLIDVRV
jgi:hypothetical protein